MRLTEDRSDFTHNLLLVDDEEVVRDSVATLLETKGFSCDTASTVEKAMELLQGNPYSAVMCDLNLDGQSGEELLAWCQSDFPDLPVIMLSGWDSGTQFDDLCSAGAVAILAKPFEMDELQATLEKVIGPVNLSTGPVQQNPDPPKVSPALEWCALFDKLSDMVSIQDRDFRLVRVNAAYARVFGKSPRDLEGLKCYQVVHRSDAPCQGCPHTVVLETEEPATSKVHQSILGLTLEVSVTPVFDEEGVLVGSVHVAKDVSELEAQQEMVSRVTNAIDSAYDGFIILDEKARISRINRSARSLLGLADIPVDSIAAEEIFLEAEIFPQIQEGCRQSGFWEGVCKMSHQSGEGVSAEVHARCIKDENGKNLGVLLNLCRITVEVMDEVQQRRFERLQGALELAGATCHELNQPLQAISVYSDLIYRHLEPETKVAKQCETLRTQVKRVVAISRKLGKMTRYQTKDTIDNNPIIDIEKSSETTLEESD